MKTIKNKKNVFLMYLVSFLQGMVFYASITTLYRTSRGLSLSEYALIDSITFVMTFLMEVPWGVVADRIGYRKTLILANGFYALSKLIFYKAYGFGGFLLERVFFSLAVSGLSGVDSSILYLSSGENESQKVFSHYSAWSNAGVLIAAGLFSLFNMSHETAALSTLVAYILSFILSFAVAEVKEADKHEEHKMSFLKVLKDTLRDYQFIIFIFGTALASVSVWVVTVFLNQDQYLAAGASERFMGIAFVISGLIGFLTVFSDPFTRKVGARSSGILLLLMMAVCVLFLSFITGLWISLLLISAVGALYGMYTPLISRIENDHVHISDRATQLSIYMMVSDVFSVIPNVMAGRIAEISLPLAFRICSGMLLISALTFLIGFRKE